MSWDWMPFSLFDQNEPESVDDIARKTIDFLLFTELVNADNEETDKDK